MALLLNAGDTVSRSYSYTQPSPLRPIPPQETGERTENLFDYTTMSSGGSGYLKADGSIASGSSWAYTDYIPCDGTSFVLGKIGGGSAAICFYDSTKTYIYGQAYQTGGAGNLDDIYCTVPQTAKYIRFTYNIEGATAIDLSTIMLNEGSTPLPYEPYGYKLDIKSANTTTPVYLGEVESTRKIKKYEFTGQETNINYNSLYTRFEVYLSNAKSNGVRLTPAFCSHYQVIDDGRAIGDVPNESLYSDVENSTRWFIKTTDYTTIPDFKAYLAAQYAAGTPVTLYYALATPETAVVNEPLRKIGDYADTVSGITIPTIIGKDIFDVETTLKSSEVSLAYSGWHDAEVKEKSENLFDTFDIVGQVPTIGTGELIGYNGSTTSLIPINSGLITLTKQQGILIYFMLYASDKSYIGYSVNSEEVTIYGSSVTGYENAKYCRVRIDRTTELDTIRIMLNTGSTALPYEPYWK